MKNRQRNGLIILFTLWLSGCATSYSLTENELEGYLNDALRKEHSTELASAVSANLTLSDVDVKVGKVKDKIDVTARSSIKVETPIIPLRAELLTTFQATPWYDPEDHSVYLRGMELVQVEAKPKQLEKAIIPFTQEAMQWVQLYLESQPVYQLEDKDWTQDLLRRFGKELRVEPGRLEFVLKP